MTEKDERVERLLKTVLDHFDLEDRFVRERQIRIWKKLKYYWSGFQRIWYDDVAHDWRVYGINDTNNQQLDNSYYDKSINVFRALLESIIAALSVTVPSIICYPDDAENSLDLATAKAGDRIADLISKHNDVTLLWIHALFIYCTEGMIAAYTYPKEDYKFGSYSEQKHEKEEIEQDSEVCPNCGAELIPPQILETLQDEYEPDDSDVELHDFLNNNTVLCPECQAEILPEIQKKKVTVDRIVGVINKPKSRQCIEVYGGLYVKVPNYARKQEDVPYLIYAYETHYSNAVDRYPHLRSKFDGTSKVRNNFGGMSDPYERWGRLSTQYLGEYPINTVTIRNAWFRPSAFNVLNDEEDINYLKKHFPDGARVVFVDDSFAESENESLDDSWTLTHNPLSDYIHFDPLGMLVTSVQEITSDIISLTLQTIEHGIPQTFADPSVLNFAAYGQTEVSPGTIYPARPAAGKGMGDAFYEVKTATLSGEVLPFADKIQESGQFVSGALPSLFGGAQPGSSRTAAQYAMSRAQALQRLQTPWKMLNVWWKNIFGKVIPAYIKELADDEKYVQKDKSSPNGFLNVYIRKAELEGKIGSIELESSEELPQSWAQKKDVYMQLMQAANPVVMAALTSPENILVLKQAIGLDDFAIPGDNDRTKQYEEIQLLLMSQPIIGPDGQPQSSVEIDFDVDNHQVEAEICRGWLVGDSGRMTKLENPPGYKNILLHMKAHVMAAAQMQQQMMMSQPAPGGQQPQQGPSAQPKPVQNQQQNSPQGQGNVRPIAARLPKGQSNG